MGRNQTSYTTKYNKDMNEKTADAVCETPFFSTHIRLSRKAASINNQRTLFQDAITTASMRDIILRPVMGISAKLSHNPLAYYSIVSYF